MADKNGWGRAYGDPFPHSGGGVERGPKLAELASLLSGLEEMASRLGRLQQETLAWRDSPIAEEILAVQRALESACRRMAKAVANEQRRL